MFFFKIYFKLSMWKLKYRNKILIHKNSKFIDFFNEKLNFVSNIFWWSFFKNLNYSNNLISYNILLFILFYYFFNINNWLIFIFINFIILLYNWILK